MAVQDFKDLIVWRKAIDLAAETYKISRALPSDEQFGLISQMRRAASSVPANIAEGHSRQGREFSRYLSIARGSLSELESHLLLGVRLNYLTPADLRAIDALMSEIRRMIASLSRKLRERASGS